jgi:hypothetical protein
MARRRTDGVPPAVYVAGGIGLGVFAGAIFVRHREREQAKAYVLGAVRVIAQVLNIVPPSVCFRGCANAATDGYSICINLDWVEQELNSSCTDGFCTRDRIYGVIAHEFGHIVDRYLRLRSHLWLDEYFADAMAGRILRRLNLDPNHFVDAVFTFPWSATHPPGQWRVDHVWHGYSNAYELLAA